MTVQNTSYVRVMVQQMGWPSFKLGWVNKVLKRARLVPYDGRMRRKQLSAEEKQAEFAVWLNAERQKEVDIWERSQQPRKKSYYKLLTTRQKMINRGKRRREEMRPIKEFLKGQAETRARARKEKREALAAAKLLATTTTEAVAVHGEARVEAQGKDTE